VSDTDWGALSGSALEEVLSEARQAGFLGPGPLETHLRHAAGFARIARSLQLETSGSAPRLLDLGSGGGLPGLVIAALWPSAQVVLLDANERRTSFLEEAVGRLGYDNIEVLCGRAEELGRELQLRASFELAAARSFGAPAVLAECAAPFLKEGGWLVVSEPPAEDREAPPAGRWPSEPLALLGLSPADRVHDEFAYQVLHQVEACPERYPRRVGIPAKRPLF
jgi:16S rRNA (guanine527-N7)-methyltransferase